MNDMNRKLSYLMLGTGLALTLSSCENKDADLDLNPDIVDAFIPTVVADYDVVKPSNFIKVDVEEGYYAEVMVDDVVICTTLESTIVEVPNEQYSVLSKSKNCVTVTHKLYDPNDKPLGLINEPSGAFMYKTVLFEDMLEGSDYDYNDLVIHVQQKVSNDKKQFRLYIQPVAMGNAQTLTLGADIYTTKIKEKDGEVCKVYNYEKVSTLIFSRDVKSELFGVNHSRTYINTCDPYFDGTFGKKYDGYPMYFVTPKDIVNHSPNFKLNLPDASTKHFYSVNGDMKDRTYAINWFIINELGDTIYAVPTVNHEAINWTTKDGYPFGLVISKVNNPAYDTVDGEHVGWDWFNYANEKVNIAEVYTDFSNWIEGKSTMGADGWKNPEAGKYYPAIQNKLYDVAQWMGTPQWNRGEPAIGVIEEK